MRRTTLSLTCIVLVAGCTSVNVKPATTTQPVDSVCIIDNPKVIVADFLGVLEDAFARHGIQSQVLMQGASQAGCTTTVTYTARRKWDITPFLAFADVRMHQGGREIGRAQYEHAGGLSLMKWRSTQAKMDPVLDQMLAGLSRPTQPSAAAAVSSTTQAPSPEAAPAPPPPPAQDCKACAKIGRDL